MNGQNATAVSRNLTEEKNNDELIIIKEDYQSSPKFGIKYKIVKKVIKNIIFTPVEISAQPYFKYCVTQIKEEQKMTFLKPKQIIRSYWRIKAKLIIYQQTQIMMI